MNMLLTDYQDFVLESFLFKNKPTIPNPDDIYADENKQVISLGLGGECGEVLEILKKVFRDKKGEMTKEDLENLVLELGDVFWHVAAMAEMYGLSLEQIAKANMNKLNSRNEGN